MWECVAELANGLKKSKPTAPCKLQREDGTEKVESLEKNPEIFKRSFNTQYGMEPSSNEGVEEQVQ